MKGDALPRKQQATPSDSLSADSSHQAMCAVSCTTNIRVLLLAQTKNINRAAILKKAGLTSYSTKPNPAGIRGRFCSPTMRLVDKRTTMFESKFLKTVLLAAVIVGGIWLLANRDQLSQPDDVMELVSDKWNQWTSGSDEQPTDPNQPLPTRPDAVAAPGTTTQSQQRVPSQFASHRQPAGRVQGVIRIASFRLNPNVAHLRSFEPIHMMSEICRQYDIVVLQNIDRNDSTWLKSVTDQMNIAGAVGTKNRPALPNGKLADYVYITDRSKRDGRSQTAMIYNEETVQLDQSRWYLVDDPDQVFQVNPMVAWFRALGAAPENQFTFNVVSVEIDSLRPDKELVQLGLLMRAVRNDGRGEDDVIIVGDFQTDDRGLEVVRNQAGLAWIVSRQATTVKGDRQFDNIVFSEPATLEFTGRGGVVEFHNLFGLQLTDALSVSDRLPVWAEFSIEESY